MLGKPTWRSVDKPQFSPPIDMEGDVVSGQAPDSKGFSHVMAQSIPIPSLPPPRYGQSSSPGKGDFSDNNVSVDLTKRVGQPTSVRRLTHLAHHTIMHVVTWIVHTAPHGRTRD